MPTYYDADGKPLEDTPSYYDGEGKPLGPPPELQGHAMASSLGQKVGNFAVHSLPAIGGVLGALGGGGPIGGAAGAGLGSVVETELKNEFPQLFGNIQSKSVPSLVGGIAADAIGQGALPEVGSMLMAKPAAAMANLIGRSPLKYMPAVKEGVQASNVADISKKILTKQYPETNIIETAGENASNNAGEMTQAIADAQAKVPKTKGPTSIADVPISDKPIPLSPEEQAATDKLTNTFGPNQVGKKLIKLHTEYLQGDEKAATQTYKDISNQTLSDVVHVKNFKLATGEPDTVRHLATNDLITKGWNGADSTFNPDAVLGALGGAKKEIYQEALGDSYKPFNDFLKEAQEQTKDTKGITDRLLHYSQGHLLWTVPGTIAAVAGGHETLGGLGAAASGFILTNKMLQNLMSNPDTAKLVVQAMKTPLKSGEATLLNQALTNSLRLGTAVTTVPPAGPPQ